MRAILQREVHRRREEQSQHKLHRKLLLNRQAVAGRAEFDPVVPCTQRTERCHHADAAQCVRAAEISAKQRGQNNCHRNKQTSHRGRGLLPGMEFVQSLGRADDPFLKSAFQPPDHNRPQKQSQQERQHTGQRDSRGERNL